MAIYKQLYGTEKQNYCNDRVAQLLSKVIFCNQVFLVPCLNLQNCFYQGCFRMKSKLKDKR